jgi:rhamnulose-1-phosphate aldolase/alcohol dehydrogenase
MRLSWSDNEARGKSAVDLLVYRSNLLGQDPTIVNWKGGNTSAKADERDHASRPVRVLWVKGSGSDLRTMQAKDCAGLRLDEILFLLQRDAMPDADMVQYLMQCRLRPDAPRPSIETLLHAFLPFAHIDHTHPDAVIAFCTAEGGEALTRQVFGDRVIWIPYQRPGFALSKAVAQAVQHHPDAKAVFLAKHGLVTWGEDARSCYAATQAVVEEAHQGIASRSPRVAFGGQRVTAVPATRREEILVPLLPQLRGAVSANRPAVLHIDADPEVLEFVCSEQLGSLAMVGAACPDHLVHTKYVPCVVPTDSGVESDRLIGSTVDAVTRYVEAYQKYVAAHRHSDDPEGDPFPRVVLLAGLGMVTTGPDKSAAVRTAELYHRAIAVMRGASALSTFTSLTPREAYAVEYWPLERYKLTLASPPRELAGRVAVVTGAAGGIGRAIAERLATEGAHVGVMDIDEAGAGEVARALESRVGEGRGLALAPDVTQEDQVREAFRKVVLAYGGVDIVVSNAGLALSRAVEETTLDDWDRLFAVLARGYFLVAREAFRVMKAQQRGGAIVFVTSKNALLAGKNSSAYNAAKAAEQHLMRSLAEEGGESGIRVNAVAPDAVLRGSKIWSGAWRQERAKGYGIEERELESYYRNRTTLKVNVYPEDVAEAVLFLASARSAKTTGSTITVDGGIAGAYTR